MLIRTLKKYQPINFVLLIAISILAWLNPLLNSELKGIYIDPDPMPLYSFVVYLLGSAKFNFLCKIIAFVFVMLQGIIINGILNQYNLLGFRGYMPGILYIILSSAFIEFQQIHPMLISAFFLLFAWERVVRAYEKENTFEAYFNASFLIGLASLFYPNSIYFLIIIFLSIGLNRAGHSREFAMILAGFITVWYFYLSIYYLLTNSLNFSGVDFRLSFSFPRYHDLVLSQIIVLAYTAFLLIYATIMLVGYISNLKIPMRRNLKFLFLWFWIGIFLLLFTDSSFEIIYICAIPIATLLSMFFVNFKKGWVIEIIWVLFIMCIILNAAFPNLLKV